ncbi:MAG: response regulator [Oligoflexales bacterium]|nr:response regulator [Oligoflexales bacterium]
MGKKILIVDDSKMMRQQVKFTLGEAGFEVIEAEDGVKALEQFSEHNDIAMAIVDVNMPNMDGFEFIDNLNLQKKTIPCMMLTTECKADMIEKARKAGCVKGWLVKPFRPNQLIEAVKKFSSE